MSVTNQRKHDHLRTFQRDPDIERHKCYFDAIQLTHRALPEIAFGEVDLAGAMSGFANQTAVTFALRRDNLP